MPQRFNIVRCRICRRAIGADTQIKEVDRCKRCHAAKGKPSLKKKGKKGKVAAFSRVRHGPAEDLPPPLNEYKFRSGWERNVARMLTEEGKEWEYETKPCEFFFDGYVRGPKGYLCDFYLPYNKTYIEVKGYFSSKDRTKLRRLKKQYPDKAKKLTVILSKTNRGAINFYVSEGIKIKFYETIVKKWSKKIEHWE